MIRRLRSDEGGFTLVELLVGGVVSLIVLFAILSIGDTFIGVSAKSTRLVTTQSDQRRQIDVMTRVLRNARAVGTNTTPVLRATPIDVIVGTTDAPGAASGTAMLMRYCVDTATSTLYEEAAASGSALPASCPSSWSHGVASSVALNTAAPGQELFTFDAAALDEIERIGVNLRYNGNTVGEPRITTLRTAATIRSLVGRDPNLSLSDIQQQCNGSDALLSLSVGAHTSETVTAKVYRADGTLVGTMTNNTPLVLGPTTQGTLTVEIINVLGLKQTLFKSVSC